MTRPVRITLATFAWVLLFVVALLADRAVAQWAFDTRPLSHAPWLIPVFRAPGNFWFTACIALLLVVTRPELWRRGAFLLLSGIIGGLIYSLVKWTVGRLRPFKPSPAEFQPFTIHPFQHGLRGLINEPNQAFPSGHGTLAFATAAALGMMFPKWRWLFYPLAAVVAVERILEWAHYPSDTVAAAFIGWISALLALALCKRWTLSPFETTLSNSTNRQDPQARIGAAQ